MSSAVMPRTAIAPMSAGPSIWIVLVQHNSGTGAKSTRGRVWCLIYAERLPSRTEAMSREWYLKRDRQMRRQLALSAQGNAF